MVVGVDPGDEGGAAHGAQRWTLSRDLLEPRLGTETPLGDISNCEIQLKSVPVQASATVAPNVERAGLTRLV